MIFQIPKTYCIQQYSKILVKSLERIQKLQTIFFIEEYCYDFHIFHRVLDEGKCYDFSNIQNILYTAIFQNPSKISRANSEKLQ